ncbi:MAG: CBS domain-containing protein [Actinomycetota bacterium]|nr:CBS domain-containing protein [Actinomycetota bacterium]
MPRTVTEIVQREIPLLEHDQLVGEAVRMVVKSGLPALPVVGEDGCFAGIFGEREFMGALFPGYMKDLKYAAFVPASLDDTIEKRRDCSNERVAEHMNTEHIDLSGDFSDAAVAETFLHHRVLIIPITDEGRVVGVITRSDFFRVLAERFLDR